MNGYVVDASVVATWLLSTNKNRESIAHDFIIDNSHKLYSAELLDIEISNALTMYSSTLETVDNLFELYKTIGIELLPYLPIHLDMARQVSFDIKDTVYDSLYHTTAMTRGLTFMTMDRKYYNKAKHLGNIELLDV